MIDVFLSTCARSAERMALAAWAIAGWVPYVRAGTVRLHVQDFGADPALWEALRVFGVSACWASKREYPRANSQRSRHLLAAEAAETDPYALVDDDIRVGRRLHVTDVGIPTLDWWDYVPQVFADHPTLAMVAPIPSPGGLDPHVCESFLGRVSGTVEPEAIAQVRRVMQIPTTDPHLWYVSSIGGVRFVRRGAITDAMPSLDPVYSGGFDITLCDWLRQRGQDVAYLHRWGATHAGYQQSEIWED